MMFLIKSSFVKFASKQTPTQSAWSVDYTDANDCPGYNTKPSESWECVSLHYRYSEVHSDLKWLYMIKSPLWVK